MPTLAGNRVQGKEARAGKLGAASPAVEPAEQLIPAADGEESCAARDHLANRIASRREIRSDQLLLTILAAADVEQVVLAGAQLVADADRLDRKLQPARGRPALEDGDVAPVGVDVQVLGVQVPDADRRHAARSQYGRASPRSETIPCSASMAV